MRVAVVDIGTNSTRLLIADVSEDGRIAELARDTTVTRLGQDLERTGELAPEAMERVLAALARYRGAIDEHGATATTAVLTSAVRDSANGEQFTRRVSDEYGLDAETIDGGLEARLTFLGATSERAPGEADVVVCDIGGGSTEFVCGRDGEVGFAVSTQVGVVRHGERHLHSDPPEPTELQTLAEDVAAEFADAIPSAVRDGATAMIAVAGTATSAASVSQALEPYDPARVHGFRLTLAECELLLARLAAMPVADRREIAGLHPDRAVTVVPGLVVLVQALRAFGLDEAEVSEHDILRGAALRRAGLA